jgi:hypothetical protein
MVCRKTAPPQHGNGGRWMMGLTVHGVGMGAGPCQAGRGEGGGRWVGALVREPQHPMADKSGVGALVHHAWAATPGPVPPRLHCCCHADCTRHAYITTLSHPFCPFPFFPTHSAPVPHPFSPIPHPFPTVPHPFHTCSWPWWSEAWVGSRGRPRRRSGTWGPPPRRKSLQCTAINYMVWVQPSIIWCGYSPQLYGVGTALNYMVWVH